VTPLQTDILPKSSATFKVQFRPNADGQYYAQTLEAFCSFKSMRTFRLVTEESFALPWCLSLSACGHTFAPGGEHFIPKSLLSHRRLTFPACHAGDAAYQTVSLKNDGDTPMLFSVTQDASGVFTVLPRQGVVPRGASVLLAVRFAPPKVSATLAQFCAIQRNSAQLFRRPVSPLRRSNRTTRSPNSY
jgi:hypothetical protein